MKKMFALITLGLCLAIVGVAPAAAVIEDDFSDSSLWAIRTGADPASDSISFEDNTQLHKGSGQPDSALPAFDTITLQDGHKLTLQVDVRGNRDDSSSHARVTFGFADPAIEDGGQSLGSNNLFGYLFQMPGVDSSSDYTVRAVNGDSNYFNAGGEASVSLSANQANNVSQSEFRTLIWNLERDGDSLLFSGSMNGVDFGSGSFNFDTGPSANVVNWKFNTVGFAGSSMSTSNDPLAFQNMSVTLYGSGLIDDDIVVYTTDGMNGVSGTVEYEGGGDFASGDFGGDVLGPYSRFGEEDRARKAYVRFDTAVIESEVEEASLTFTVTHNELGGHSGYLRLYAFTDQDVDTQALSNDLTWDGAPGNDPNHGSEPDLNKAIYLGEKRVTVSSPTGSKQVTAGDTITWDDLALINFLNANTNNIVTFMVTRFERGGSRDDLIVGLAGDSHPTYDPPYLTVLPVPFAVDLEETAILIDDFEAQTLGPVQLANPVGTVTYQWYHIDAWI